MAVNFNTIDTQFLDHYDLNHMVVRLNDEIVDMEEELVGKVMGIYAFENEPNPIIVYNHRNGKIGQIRTEDIKIITDMGEGM